MEKTWPEANGLYQPCGHPLELIMKHSLLPRDQSAFFLKEAFYKVKLFEEELTKDWGFEAFHCFETMFKDILQFIGQEGFGPSITNLEWNQLTEHTIKKKHQTMCRQLYLKIKKLIACLESILGPNPYLQFNISKEHHLEEEFYHGLALETPYLLGLYPCPHRGQFCAK